MKELVIFAVMRHEPYEGSWAVGYWALFEGAYNAALNVVANEADNGIGEKPDEWEERSEGDRTCFVAKEDPYVSIEVEPVTVRQDIPEVSA